MRLSRLFAITLLLAVLIPVSTPARAQTADIVFEGSGWGHGVGMSQYGARAMAEAGHSGKKIVEYYYSGAQVTPLGSAVSGWLVNDSEPLWVNLTGTPYATAQKVSFATAGGGSLTFCQQEPASVGSMYEAKNKNEYSPYVEILEQRLKELDFNPGPVDGWFDATTTQAVKDFQSSHALDADGIVGTNTKNALWPPHSGDRCVIAIPLTSTPATLTPNKDGSECALADGFPPGACVGSIRNLTKNNRVVIPERKIRNGTSIQLAHGHVRVRPDRANGSGSFQGLHVIVEIGVDDYVRGIEEIPFSWPTQAMRAQAIASRSYGVGIARGRGPEISFTGSVRDSCWCHLWSNTFSQVYAGYYAEAVLGGVWNAAVTATDSQVLKHPTAGLATAFYSSSSGGATEANEDAWGSSPVPYLRSVADQWSLAPANPFASWSNSFSSDTVAAKLGMDGLTGVKVVATNTSGSARTVRFVGSVGGNAVTVDKTGNWVRINFGLRSNYFDVGWGDISNAPPPGSTSSTSSPTFTDTSGNTFVKDIEWLAQEGVTKGCNPPDNTRYCPNDYVTRGQMAAFLNRFLDLPAASKDHFSDDNGSTFENDINRLAEAGVTRGCNPPDNTRFCASDRVTRGQMAAFMVRALDLKADTHPGFGDVASSHTFYNDIAKLATAGITKGCNPSENTRFCPGDFVTRGQMAAFLHRAAEYR